MTNEPVSFRFSIGEVARIKDLKVPGIVLARCDRGNFHEFRVIYRYDGTRRDEWLLDEELE